MQATDLERIAKLALRELGAGDAAMTITQEQGGDRWKLQVGGSDPVTLLIRAGAGTSAQHIRTQIFEQFAAR